MTLEGHDDNIGSTIRTASELLADLGTRPLGNRI
jgi:hypothetical protein